MLRISAEQIAKITKLSNAGLSADEIAHAIDVNKRTVYRYLRQARLKQANQAEPNAGTIYHSRADREAKNARMQEIAADATETQSEGRVCPPDVPEPTNEAPAVEVDLRKASESAAVGTAIRTVQQRSQRDIEEAIKIGSAVKLYIADKARQSGHDDLLSYLQDATKFFDEFHNIFDQLIARAYLYTKMLERDHWLRVILLPNVYGTPNKEDLKAVLEIINQSLYGG